ncbi:MAG: 16S rRNA (guanine(527)-N(7))-methyltransferase RsmG [Pseudobutyrivibrio sp.]|nr:16S rRNA (guanine(527)-N(7))-methyltransferase RsmG [Pseudobutyrivibrio sp.]
MKHDYSFLKDSLQDYGFELTEEMSDKLDIFYELLVEKNKVMNLTGITEFDEVLVKHYLDSISICQIIDSDKIHTVLDLGTGAGFPGMPLAICFPNIQFTLMDSLNKRILFLQEVVDALGITNVTLVHGRAEEAARNRIYREKFDVCVSRAVANISTLMEYCLPFVKVGGQFISYKSGSIDDEIASSGNAARLLGGKIENPFYFKLKNTDIDRSFVIVNKVAATVKTYPRKAGTPSKEPLC